MDAACCWFSAEPEPTSAVDTATTAEKPVLEAEGSVMPKLNFFAPAAAAISDQLTGRPTQPSCWATERRSPSTTGDDMISADVPSLAWVSGRRVR